MTSKCAMLISGLASYIKHMPIAEAKIILCQSPRVEHHFSRIARNPAESQFPPPPKKISNEPCNLPWAPARQLARKPEESSKSPFSVPGTQKDSRDRMLTDEYGVPSTYYTQNPHSSL